MSYLKNKTNKLLEKGSTYFKTDLHYIARGGFWLTLAKIVTSLSSFASSIVFANFIPKEVYGAYRFILSYLSVLAIPTLTGIDTSLTKAVGRGYGGSIIPAFKTKIKWGLLGGLTSLGFAGYYLLQGNNTLAICFFISALFLPIMDPLQIYMAYLNGKHEYATYTKYHTILKIVVTILIVGTLFFTDNLFLIIISYLVSYTLLRLIFFIITIKKIKPTNETDTNIISFGKHLSLMNVLGTIAGALDKILVFHFIDGASLAIYFFSQTPVKLVWSMFGSLNVLALPKFSNNKTEILKSTLPRKILKFYLIVIPVIVVYIIAAPYFFKLFYPQYLSAVFFSQISILLLLFFPISFLNTALTSQSQTKKLYISSTTFSVIRITLLLILVPLFGIYGAIATSFATNIINLVLNFYLFFKMK